MYGVVLVMAIAGVCLAITVQGKQFLATTSVRGGILQAVGCAGVNFEKKVSFSIVLLLQLPLSLRMRESRGSRR